MLDLLKIDETDDPERLARSEREQVVRFCARLSGDAHAAEDLAQETLIEAWRHYGALRDEAARRAWLFGIARNICRRAARRERREVPRCTPLAGGDAPDEIAGEPAGAFDVELELERGELATLMDRAMALLPAATRSALVARYVLDLPQAEIAARLGVTEGAVEARLQRGKSALRRVLSTELRDEALVYGIGAPDTIAWQETRIWCPFCGRRKLAGWIDRDTGDTAFRCRDCASIPERQISHTWDADLISGVTSYKAVLSRQIDWLHRHYTYALTHDRVPCPICRRISRVERSLPAYAPPWFADSAGMQVICPTCGVTDANPLHYLVLDLPETQRFWRSHPRMRLLPDLRVAYAGRDALLTTYESVDGAARLDAFSDPNTLAVLAVHTSPDASC